MVRNGHYCNYKFIKGEINRSSQSLYMLDVPQYQIIVLKPNLSSPKKINNALVVLLITKIDLEFDGLCREYIIYFREKGSTPNFQ